MKSTDHLTQEHRLILRTLDVLDSMTSLIENSQVVDKHDIDKILHFMRWFADAHHQAKEETILFPALKRMAASQSRPVDHLTFEHGQERTLIEEMEKDIRLTELPQFVTCANRLSSTLRNHIYKEEQILFDTAEAVLSSRDDDAVFEQLSRFDTTLDKELLTKSLEELRSLEWKYLRKT
jgi:hemerythrin-like domain-containing protein